MLFVVHKNKFSRFISLVREDKKKGQQNSESPYLRICAQKDADEVEVFSDIVSATIKATVYEAGVLFIRTTLFRKIFKATSITEDFITIQADKDALAFADVRIKFETNDMILYKDPAEAPLRYPPPLPKNENIEKKPSQLYLFDDMGN